MRLTPKSVFFGIAILGLPFAVTVGWTLGTPARPPVTSVAAPGGAGGLGAAPERAEPASPTDFTAKQPRPSSSGPSAAVVAPIAKVPVATTTTAGPTLSVSPLPPLTDPPVPTPTTIVTSEPPSPSATPSTSPSSDPSTGGLGAGLIRRQ